ncbi:MAG: cell division protein ZipA [Gammaproteobacteria bacterium]|nr:cell division protein ZipA [Gammaproteobacteria bacterium]
MDELTFLLILAGVGVVLLVAMFTYYKHHKKINDEINDFNHHVHTIDDVLLENDQNKNHSYNDLNDELPGSFSASRQDNFDIDDVFIKHDSSSQHSNKSSSTDSTSSTITTSEQESDKRELVDGVYINTKRVINTEHSNPQPDLSQKSQSVNSFAPIRTDNASSQVVSSEPDDQNIERPPSMNPSNRQADVDYSSARVQSVKAELQQTAKNTPDTNHSSQSVNVGSQKITPKINIVYDPIPEGVEELIISHTILSKGEYFTGEKLFKALESAGLFFGEMSIYHYPGDDKAETFALFSIANVVEPGTFNPNEPESLTTPGISMFMRLPTRMGSYEAYEEFIHVAQMIAVELDGELCDETRSQLTQQAITYKKEQIRKLNFEIAKAEKLAGITR